MKASEFDVMPAIDLLDGRSVRLQQGHRHTAHEVWSDPVAQVESYLDAGAQWVHLVDLNAAFGDARDDVGSRASTDQIRAIVRSVSTRGARVRLQVGGGVRSQAQAESLFEWGVERVVIGTWAQRDPEAVCGLARRYGDRVVVGLDALHGQLAVQGWTEACTDQTLSAFAKRLAEGGVLRALCTQIESDGMLTGVNIQPLLAMAQESGLRVIASGGVAGISDIRTLADLAERGICGVVIGKALHAGLLDLGDALKFQIPGA